MILTDSVNISQNAGIPVKKDTVLEPLYLKKNPLYVVSDSGSNITCKDYILSTVDEGFAKQQQRQSLFLDKPFYHKNLLMKENTNMVNNDWVFAVFLFFTFLTALLFRFGGALTFSFLQGCFSKNQLSISTRDGENIHPLALVPVSFIFLPLVSFILFYTIIYFDWQNQYVTYLNGKITLANHPFFLWLSIYVGTLILYYAKIILIKLLSQIFRAKKISNYYVQIQLNFSILMGFAIFLPTFCLVYAGDFYREIFLIICALIIVILYVIKLIRLTSIIIASFKFSYLYLFFYLCTLELLPIILIGKRLFF